MTPGRPRPRSSRTPLEERSFHAWLARTLPWGSHPLLPLGDDAAALEVPRGARAVVSTDTLVEGRHFLRGSPPELVGRAAAAVGLSDVASKGARPAALLLAVIVPPGTPESWARSLVVGAERLAARHGAHVVGGDTKAGATPTIVGTVVGWSDARRLVARSTARPNDLLVTTGTVGRGGAASIGLGLGAGRRRRAVNELLDVRPRVAEGVVLARYARAMLDTSDGLAEAATLLSEASRVRAEIDERRLPWDRRLAALPPERRRRLAFYGGDYELLAAVPPGRLAAARRALAPTRTALTVIGSVRPGRGAFLTTPAGTVPMPPGGWQPFGGPRRPRP